MSSTSSPTVSRRWLALEIRRLRKARRLSQAAVAKALGCQVPKVSLLETGTRPIQDDDLKTLLELFDVPDEGRQLYFDELRNAHEKGWWEFYDEATVPEWYAQFIGFEQGADKIRAYQPAIVHGLLQTPDYADGLFRGMAATNSEEKIARMVQVRMRRQERFRGDAGPHLSAILDESVLHRVVGSREVMQRQLQDLVQRCQSSERITLQIVPFDRGAGAFEAAHGAFTILSFRLGGDSGFVYRERRSAGEFLEQLPELDAHSSIFQGLADFALSRGESLELLDETARRYGRSR